MLLKVILSFLIAGMPLIHLHISRSDAYPRVLGETEEGWIIAAEGIGRIIEGDKLAARAQAERDAMRRVIEFQIGNNIGSHTIVQNSELVHDVVHAHADGYAKKLGYIDGPNLDPDDPNCIKVVLKTLVSKKVHDVAAVVANPKVLFVGVEVRASLSEAERHIRLARKLVVSSLREKLTSLGWELAYLPEDQVRDVRELIDKLAVLSLSMEERENATASLWSMNLGNLADIFLLGELEVSTRKANLTVLTSGNPNTTDHLATSIDGNLQLIRFDPDSSTARLVAEKMIRGDSAKGIHKVPAQAIRIAVEGVEEKVDQIIHQIDKEAGSPRRLIVLYVKGLASKYRYEDMQEWLTNFDPGIEKADGMIFDPVVSKFILTITRQTAESNRVADVVKYLARMLDATSTWRLLKHASFTLMIEKEN